MVLTEFIEGPHLVSRSCERANLFWDRWLRLLGLEVCVVAGGNRAEALQTVRGYVSSGLHGIDEIARIRTDPDFDSLRGWIRRS